MMLYWFIEYLVNISPGNYWSHQAITLTITYVKPMPLCSIFACNLTGHVQSIYNWNVFEIYLLI